MFSDIVLVLAMRPAGSSGMPALVLWAVVGLLILLVGGVVIGWTRKRIHQSMAGKNSPNAFNLDEIKKMRDNNQISDEEYKALRARVMRDMM